jgi:hypothetical protein
MNVTKTVASLFPQISNFLWAMRYVDDAMFARDDLSASGSDILRCASVIQI